MKIKAEEAPNFQSLNSYNSAKYCLISLMFVTYVLTLVFPCLVLGGCMCNRLLEGCIQLRAELHTAMSKIFYSDTVDEWLSVSVDSVINKLARIVTVASQQIQLGARVKTSSASLTMNANATQSMQ